MFFLFFFFLMFFFFLFFLIFFFVVLFFFFFYAGCGLALWQPLREKGPRRRSSRLALDSFQLSAFRELGHGPATHGLQLLLEGSIYSFWPILALITW